MQKVSEREIQNKSQRAIVGFRDGEGGELTRQEDSGKEDEGDENGHGPSSVSLNCHGHHQRFYFPCLDVTR